MIYLSLSDSPGGASKASLDGRFESQPLAQPSLQGVSISDAESAMVQHEDSRRLLRKTIACVILLTAAYAFLVPGLVTKMFSAKAVVGVSTVLDIEKSTVGLIAMLMQQGLWLPAIVIMLYSVVMPFAKLSVLIAYALPPEWRGAHADSFLMSERGVRAVQQISKWATVDVFTAGTICGLFCQPHMYLEIMLHDGFYYFISYCVLSIVGALLIELPDQAVQRQNLQHGSAEENVQSKAGAFLMAALALGAMVAVACLPILKAEFAIINLNARVSIGTLISSLWGKGFEWAALCIALLALAVPALDFVFVALDFAGVTFRHQMLRKWVRDFSMLDVYALACIVVVTAVSALHNDLHMSVLPAGWILFALSVPWVIYQWSSEAMSSADMAPTDSE